MEISSSDLKDWLSDSPLRDASDYVVLGEYGTKKGIRGGLYIERCLFFVPEDRAKYVLSMNGEFWMNNFRPDECDSYSIDDPINCVRDDKGEKYETLIYTWGDSPGSGDIKSIWPSMRLCQRFCLISRIIKDLENEKIAWDDLSKPNYDVIVCKPISKFISYFNIDSAVAKIRREYLIKFAKEIKCNILEVFFIETECVDPEKKYSWNIEHEAALSYKVVCDGEGSKNEQIYGVRSVFNSLADADLIESKTVNDYDWPKEWCNTSIFVRDLFLRDFERMDDVDVFPYRASVRFRNQWEFRGVRTTRNAVVFNTFDLNVPEHVLDILYRNCISEEDFFRDREVYGNTSISDRAQELCESFYELMYVISVFLRIPIEKLFPVEREEGDIIWWCRSNLRLLGYCAPVDMSKGELANRCRDIIKYLIESVNVQIMRESMIGFGIPHNELKGQGSIKLIGALLQIIDIMVEKGYRQELHIGSILLDWKKDRKLPFWSSVFFVNQIRAYDSHQNSGTHELNSLINNLGIDHNLLKSEGGLVLDRIYEKLAKSFREGISLITKVLGCR